MKTIHPVYWALLFSWSVLLANAQSRLNFGLATRQPENELPRSKAVFIQPVKKPYRSVAAGLIRDEDGNYRFGGGWELSEGWKLSGHGRSLWDVSRRDTGWYPAVVPGTVLTTLVREGVYPDPYYGVNNLYIPATLCRMDWWYRIAFDTPGDISGSGYELCLDGIKSGT